MAGLHVSQLFRWRKELCKHGETSIAPFVPVEIGPSVPPREVAEAPLTTTARRRKSQGIIEIDLGSGHRIRVDGDVDGDALRRVLDALVRRRSPFRRARECGSRRLHGHAPRLSVVGTPVQEVLRKDPLSGHLFVFRGRRSDLVKVIWHDGQGACLLTKRLERGRFIWPSVAGEAVTISSAQMSYLLSGIDWRNPQETQRPTRVG